MKKVKVKFINEPDCQKCFKLYRIKNVRTTKRNTANISRFINIFSEKMEEIIFNEPNFSRRLALRQYLNAIRKLIQN